MKENPTVLAVDDELVIRELIEAALILNSAGGIRCDRGAEGSGYDDNFAMTTRAGGSMKIHCPCTPRA